MKLIDLRGDNDNVELGDIIVSKGDSSMWFYTTDKGYRLILDGYNMEQLVDRYMKVMEAKK